MLVAKWMLIAELLPTPNRKDKPMLYCTTEKDNSRISQSNNNKAASFFLSRFFVSNENSLNILRFRLLKMWPVHKKRSEIFKDENSKKKNAKKFKLSPLSPLLSLSFFRSSWSQMVQMRHNDAKNDLCCASSFPLFFSFYKIIIVWLVDIVIFHTLLFK